jgi:hypothetical protein
MAHDGERLFIAEHFPTACAGTGCDASSGPVVRCTLLFEVGRQGSLCLELAPAQDLDITHQRIREIAMIGQRHIATELVVEQLIGSIRREVVDHVMVLHEQHLRGLLTGYIQYYHRFRTHLSLAMDGPEPRPVGPPAHGRITRCLRLGDSIIITNAARHERTTF